MAPTSRSAHVALLIFAFVADALRSDEGPELSTAGEGSPPAVLSSGPECACTNPCSTGPGLQVPRCNVWPEAANKSCLLQHSGLYAEVSEDETGGFRRECEYPEGHRVFVEAAGAFGGCSVARLGECVLAKYGDLRGQALACEELGLTVTCTALDMACAQLHRGSAEKELQTCTFCQDASEETLQRLEAVEMCAGFKAGSCQDQAKRKLLRSSLEPAWFAGGAAGTESASVATAFELQAQCEEVVSAGWNVFEVERILAQGPSAQILIDADRGKSLLERRGGDTRMRVEGGEVPRHPVLGFPIRFGGAFGGMMLGAMGGATVGGGAGMVLGGAAGFRAGHVAGEQAADFGSRLAHGRVHFFRKQQAELLQTSPGSGKGAEEPAAAAAALLEKTTDLADACLPHSPKCGLVVGLAEAEVASGREDKPFYGALLDLLADGSDGYKLARGVGQSAVAEPAKALSKPSERSLLVQLILDGLKERASGGGGMPGEVSSRARAALERIKGTRPDLAPQLHAGSSMPTCPGCAGFSVAKAGTVDRAIDIVRLGASYIPSRFTAGDEKNAHFSGVDPSEAMDSAVVRRAGAGLRVHSLGEDAYTL